MTEMMRAADLPYDDFEAMWALVGKTVLGSDGRLLKLGIGPNPGMSVILRHGFELHNPDGPALVAADGSKVWYRHNERHRLDGPASQSGNGWCLWMVHDRLHRIDGPAVVDLYGTREFWIDGVWVHPDDPRLMLGDEPV